MRCTNYDLVNALQVQEISFRLYLLVQERVMSLFLFILIDLGSNHSLFYLEDW
jgi:hypothetical protein